MKPCNQALQYLDGVESCAGLRPMHAAFRRKVVRAVAAIVSLTLPAAPGFSVSRPGVTGGLSQAPSRLSLTDIVRYVHAGESEEAIIGRIKRNARAFDLAKEEKDELKREGVSDTLIKYLIDPTLPYTPAPPAPPPPPAPVYPDDAFASKVPQDPGAYILQRSDLVRIDLKTLLAATQGGLTSKLTIGLLKSKVVGHLVGSSARTRAEIPPVILYLRLPEPAKIEEVAVVAFEADSKQRTLAFAPEKAKDGKPILKTDAVRQFDSVAVGPRLYKLTLAGLNTGEYFVYLIGSADPEKGIPGKGYDFGVN